VKNCKAKRLVGPYGSWTREELLGAHVKISSMPVSNFVKGFDCNQICTIKDISFRVSNEGKTITIIVLDQFPEYTFGWKDIEVVGIVVKPINNGNESEESESDKA
jgi:hypothetical protein